MKGSLSLQRIRLPLCQPQKEGGPLRTLGPNASCDMVPEPLGDGNFVGPIERYVEVDPRLVRTNEIHDLRADASLIRKQLGWETKVDFPSLVRMMLESDLAAAGEVLQKHMAANR